jgi:hypothetical protein
MSIKVGDTVTWRKAGRPGFEPLGVTGCKVLDFGTAENGEPAAVIEAMGQRVNAYVKDLHPETGSDFDAWRSGYPEDFDDTTY